MKFARCVWQKGERLPKSVPPVVIEALEQAEKQATGMLWKWPLADINSAEHMAHRVYLGKLQAALDVARSVS